MRTERGSMANLSVGVLNIRSRNKISWKGSTAQMLLGGYRHDIYKGYSCFLDVDIEMHIIMVAAALTNYSFFGGGGVGLAGFVLFFVAKIIPRVHLKSGLKLNSGQEGALE